MKQEIKEKIIQIGHGIILEGYKKTDDGICPIDWGKHYFKDLYDFYGGLGIPREKLGKTGVLYLHYGDMHTSERMYIDLDKDIDKLPRYDKNVSKDQMLLNGDIVFVDASEDYEGTCKTFVIYNKNDLPLVAGLHTFFGRNKTNLLNIDFQKYLTKIPEIKKQIFKYVQGYKVYGISRENISKIYVNLPNNDEQENIAKILDCATRQVELQEQLVDKLKVQKKALMQRVFNGEYETISIQEALNKNYLREIKPKELQKYDGTKNYLSTSSIIQDEIVLIEDVVTYENRPSRAQMKPLENSVWFAKMTNSIKVIKADKNLEDNYILSTGFYGFLCDEINLNSNFLKQVFLSDYFNKTKDLYSEGSSQNGIKSNALEKLLIPFIELEKQLEIAEWLSFLDKNILLQQKLLKQYKLQQKALMQLLLTGIVRVC